MLKNSELKSLAGAGAYARGKDYYAQGRVRLTRVGKIAIEGEAYGTETYALWLKREGAEWRYACACPVGAEGSFCKHLVAAGLAWQNGEREPQPVNVHDELLEYLRAQPAERLAGWLKEFADEDRDVLCGFGTEFVEATPSQVAALRTAVEPVYRMIERGAGNADAIARIRELKGDAAAPYEKVMEVLAAAKRLDIAEVGLVTKKAAP